MREIKFRVWDKINKKWIKNFNIDLLNIDVSELPNIEIMQYTGLKDKNRENIYEGDILYWTDKSELSDETLSEKAEVFWNKELLRWSVKIKIFNKTHISDLSDYDNQEEIEVIGNIHENPELLEEGN